MTEPLEQGFLLSPQQLRAWRLQKDGAALCSVLCALRMEGDLDRRALRRALAATVARHEILRTAFRHPAGLSMPLQVILEPGPVSLTEVDLRELSRQHQSASTTALLSELGGLPFHLERGEGWRAALVRLGHGEHEMLFALSAVCGDAGAFEPLAADLLAAYTRQVAGEGPDPEPPLQYADVAEWQNSLLEGEDAAEGLDTWREHWRGSDLDARISLPLPLQESEAAPGPFVPRQEAVPLARETAGALTSLAQAWDCPLQALLLTAWKAVIQRGTGRDESLVGVLYPGRDTEELRGVVGPLARYLPIVARFSTESSLQEAVAKVRQAMKRAESWGEYFSWEHVAGNGHGAGGFPVCFEAGMKDWTQAVDGLRASSAWRSSNGTVLDSFSIALSCTGEGEDLRLALRYDPRRFRREAARRLAGRVAALLGSVAARPEASLADHPAMAEDELKLWLRLSMAPSAADRGRKGKTLHAVFEEQVDRTPDRLAVVAGDSHLTFRELDVRANCLAHYLRAAGAGPEVVVALCLERSVEAVMALLAVWKAGAAYVPLDPTQPTERLVYLLEDTGAPLLVTDSRLASGLPGAGRLPGLRTVRLDEEAAEIALQPAERPAGGAGFRSLAYVIYTSGSTGRPKGVQIEHRSALHLLTALEAAVLDPLAQAGLLPDPLLASLNAPMIFDASIQQLALLLDGHALCIVPQDIRADGTALLAFLRDRQVDLLDCTPSQLRLLVRAGLLDDAAGPRCVLTAGEAVDEPLWRRLAHAERTVCFNLYGPTECSVDATFHRIEPGSSRPTIGRPLAGYEVFLLDQFLQPVPLGAPGELCLGGAGLARGYLLRPDLTAERFVPHPFAGRPGERLYRTGDLGCHLPNGDLEFLGRLDHQVKIRGFRIELGEIEEVLAEQAGVHDAVVVAHGSATEDQRLVAYLVGDTPTDALRQALRQRLPDYMMPATFVTLAALPLTPNGKVDRKALPAPAWHGEEEYLPPRTPVEEILAGIWAELLGLERVGVADHFFDLGGHSLLATQVMSRLRNTFDIEMPLRELFAAPRLADLAARVEEVRWAGTLSPVPPLLALPREGSLPLSFAQQRLWFIDLLEPGSPLYNISVALRAAGSLDTAVLALCFGEIVRRHEVLRTVFSAPEGSPAQVIQPAEPFRLPMVDLSELPESTREALLLKLVGQEVGRPFDLTRGPLLRCVLLRLAERDHGVVLTMHHIVSDGWSMSILVREFAALYAAFAAGRPSPLPELPVQYADFALWQRSWLQGEVLENEISFWQRQLTGLPPLLELPTDRLRPAVQSFRGANRPVRLPTELTRQLHALGRHEGATLFMVLLAVFQTLLARHSGQDDLAVGSPIAGRNRIETEGLIGFFVNTLVLRGDLTGEPTFRELLRRVRETALAAYLHQDVPFERLVEELAAERSLSHSPLFQVMLVLQNAPAESLEIRDLLLLPVAVEATTAKFDLTLSLSEHNGGLIGMVEYAADLFDATTIGRMLRHFESLTEAVVADPGRRLAEIPLLSAEEHHQLFREWNRTAAPHPHQPSLHQMFQEQARRTPGAPAVTFENRTLTYAELDNEANRVARRLRALDCGPETRVAVAMERSLELVIALLGVLKTGAAYVPLDPEYPRDRLAFMLEDARPAVLLTLGSLLPRLPEALIPVLLLDPEDRASERAQPITEPMDGMNAAYVIYTSGSTGHPKGVVVTHDNAVRLFASTHDLFRFGPEDVWTLFHSYAFDFSVWEIWGALLYGGRLVVVPWWVSRSPESFHDLLVHEKVTVLNQTPTAFRQLLRADDAARKETALRLVIFGGEALDLESLSPWMARHGSERPRLINMYGITETTVHVTYRPISAADVERGRTSPIGVPIPDLQLHLLDPASRPVPIGVPGEIYVGGRGVARGYLNRPDLTAERFVPDPFSEIPGERLYRTGDLARRRADGGVEYLGRIDTQVKVRGFRIELGEIEAALSSHPAVRDSVVIVRKDSQGDLLLTAYVVPRTDGPLPIADLRRDLEKRLPLYMIPASFVRTEALPLSPSGKVDRRALARMAPGQPEEKHEHVPPQGPEEELLAAIWEEVLGVELVGADDNFFALGGDSIRSIQVRAAAERRGLGFTVQQIFKNPTVRALIRELRRESGQEESFALVPPFGLLAPEDRLRLPQGIEDAYPLAMLQAGMLFHTEIRPESAIYHDVFSFRLRGPLDLAALRAALQEATAQHPVLRTSFDLSAYSEPLQLVHREAEVPVEAEDLRDLSKEEQDRRIASWLAGEKRRPL
ncbi:MAG TPA: amino acid adenylation domain-containing protein, partial [Thermoanaerobaculia bacterium]|nr:amino acid adenylation domain-containing protein [Thermoanaerobaculia bacterium]